MTTPTQTLLLVVAHPDDETFGCGSLLLAAAEAGLRTVVLCATRGEAGEAHDATLPADLGAVRERETRDAAALLGVAEVEFLGLRDSGMAGPTPSGTLVGAPADRVRDLVAETIDRVRPDVVVTLDGSDGHRDHGRIRDATLAAVVRTTHQVGRVYLHCLPQRLMRRWVEHMAAHDPSWEHLLGDVPGTPDADVTTTLETRHLLAAREAAIRVHRTQRSPFDGLPADLRRDFLTTDQLRRVVPPWRGGPPERSLTTPTCTTEETP